MAPRFGATKFRNAVPAIPPRDQWYRTHLPSASDAPANTSSFSSVVKTNREWMVTLTPSGDASVRGYASVGEREGEAWNGRLGTVLDWDLSRLEDGGMVVAGGDGSVSILRSGRCAVSGVGRTEVGARNPVYQQDLGYNALRVAAWARGTRAQD